MDEDGLSRIEGRLSLVLERERVITDGGTVGGRDTRHLSCSFRSGLCIPASDGGIACASGKAAQGITSVDDG